MKKLRLFYFVYWALFACAMFTMQANPFGWGQRIFWNMHPPYHWRMAQEHGLPSEDVAESYYDTNGLACASVYHYHWLDYYYKVYGYGFSAEKANRAEAEALAERECR